MNDKFMYASQPELRPEFVEALYTNISKEKGLASLLNKFLSQLKQPGVWASLLAILILFVACARQFLSPEAHYETNINGIHIIETNYIPYMRSWLLSFEGAEENIESIILRHGEFRADQQFVAPLEEAIEQLPYSFKMPTWTPEGYKLASEVPDNPSMWQYSFYAIWTSEENDGRIQLATHRIKEFSSQEAKVAPGKWEVIEINGVEVIVIRGRFDALFQSIEDYHAFLASDEKEVRTYWNDELGIKLVWIQGGIYYQLGSPGFIGNGGHLSPIQATQFASEDDLIKMAESIIIE